MLEATSNREIIASLVDDGTGAVDQSKARELVARMKVISFKKTGCR